MEKDQLLFLARNFDSLTVDEAMELVSLKSSFPYCQLIHNLAARGAHDHRLEKSEHELQLSAVYSMDRSVLKSIMASPRTQRLDETPTLKIEVSEQNTSASATSSSNINLSGDDLLAEIAHDLARLKELKHEFEISVHDLESGITTQRIKPEVSKLKLPPELIEPNSEELMKEIKSSKKKIKPEGAKQKEQFEIIDQFIKTQPTISNAKAKTPLPSTATDLTESNLAFGDNIISETLVDILLKQGKKDKALEVLKKLIWKFPQKKAYFAAQIEELKK